MFLGWLGGAFSLFLIVIVVAWWRRRRWAAEEEEADDLCFRCLEEAEDRCRLPQRPFATRCLAFTPIPDQPEPSQGEPDWEE